jgi:hypothetical protein
MHAKPCPKKRGGRPTLALDSAPAAQAASRVAPDISLTNVNHQPGYQTLEPKRSTRRFLSTETRHRNPYSKVGNKNENKRKTTERPDNHRNSGTLTRQRVSVSTTHTNSRKCTHVQNAWTSAVRSLNRKGLQGGFCQHSTGTMHNLTDVAHPLFSKTPHRNGKRCTTSGLAGECTNATDALCAPKLC